MEKQNQKCTVLMTGPASSVQGGIRTVVNQYLEFDNWNDVELIYIPSYIESTTVRKVLLFLSCILKVSATCALKHVDVLHMHVSERGSFWRKSLLLKLCRRKGIKTILHHHGAEFFDFYENESPRGKEKIAQTIYLADRNLVLSDYHRSMMQQRFPQAKYEVLYNAVSDSVPLSYHADADGILFVGRMGKRKGVYDLIAALAELEDKLPPNIKFYFCGDGEVEKVRNLLTEMNLMHRVAHVGWCSKAELSQFMAKTMLFVLPSYHEGLPMSLLEAMLAGLPCISTNVDGIPELIQSERNGLLVEPGNLKQLEAALMQLVQDNDLRQKLSAGAQQTVSKQFLLTKHIESLKSIYYSFRR